MKIFSVVTSGERIYQKYKNYFFLISPILLATLEVTYKVSGSVLTNKQSRVWSVCLLSRSYLSSDSCFDCLY